MAYRNLCLQPSYQAVVTTTTTLALMLKFTMLLLPALQQRTVAGGVLQQKSLDFISQGPEAALH